MQPKAPKRPLLLTPEPIRQRVVARHIQGESQRQIAREEGIDRGTVGRILSQTEVVERLAAFDADFLDMAPEAIRAIRAALTSEDERIRTAAAFRFVELMHKRGMEQMMRTAEAAAPKTTEKSGHSKIMEQLEEMMLIKAKNFDIPLPPEFETKATLEKLERAEAADESDE
jgi:Homeodomain-like domain